MDYKSRLIASVQQHKYFVFMFLFFIVVYLYTTFTENTDHVSSTEKLLTVDTLIPSGYTLVPIELENISTIASLIESYGVVDIYVGKSNIRKAKQIFQKVKILRAPNNPNAYSLLLPDHLSSELLKYDGPFYAVIQNKSEIATDPTVKTKPQTKKSIKIEYNGG